MTDLIRADKCCFQVQTRPSGSIDSTNHSSKIFGKKFQKFQKAKHEFFMWQLFTLHLYCIYNLHSIYIILASLVAQMVKSLPAVQETCVQSLGWEDPLEKEVATHSSILAWKILWIEEPGRLQSMGSQRVGHD